MIVLDTNVISETWKPMPDARVLAWLDSQAIETLCLSAITIAELRFGIAAMPVGRRRTTLDDRLEQEVLPLFVARILPFDLDTSRAYADLIREDFEGYISAVQEYFRCLDAERARAFSEAQEVSQDYGRFQSVVGH